MNALTSFAVVLTLSYPAAPADDLFEAIGRGDTATVKKLLADHPELATHKNAGGYTPLHSAAALNRADIAKLLLDANADIQAKGDDDTTPLHSAAVNGGKEVVAVLLDRGAAVDAPTKTDRFTPLHRAAQRGHVPVMTLLLAKGAAVDGGWNGKDLNPSIAPLHFAVREEQLDAARLLLAKGATVDAAQRLSYRTPLYEAADRGDPEMVKLLLRNGANPNEKGPLARVLQFGRPELIQLFVAKGAVFTTDPELLVSATVSGKKEMVELVLKGGFNVADADNRGISALVYAAREGHTDIVRLLLEKGVAPNIGKEYTTPLHVAATKEIAELLLKHRAKIDADEPDKRGVPPMLAAVMRGNKEVAEALEAAGATHTVETLAALGRDLELKALLEKEPLAKMPKPKDADRPTALYWAASFGQIQTVRVLLDAGADVNTPRENLETPLHAAAAGGHLRVAEFLVERKADVNAKMKPLSFHVQRVGSVTPLTLALEHGHADVVRFLAKAGGLPAIDGAKNAAAQLPGAARGKHLGVVKLLIEQGAPADTKLDQSGGTALHLAAEMGDLDMMKWLLTRKLDLKATDGRGWTPLLRAVVAGRTEVVRFLLKEGAKPVDSALFQAAAAGHTDMVTLLLDSGAKHDAVSEGLTRYTVLGHAAAAGKLEVVKLLHAKGASVKDTGAMHAAALYGHRAVVAFMLEKGADVEEHRLDGFNLYYRAFQPRRLALLSFFAETGPEILKGHRAGVTIAEVNGGAQFAVTGGRPLQAAVAGRQKAVAELLLDKGASAKVLFPDGSTLLHLAAELGDTELIDLLVKHGVPVDVRNKQGQTALGIAIDRYEEDVAALLRKHGAKEPVRSDR